MEGKFNLRLEMVEYAKRHSQKEAMRAYSVSKPTIRKWVERYDSFGLNGLLEQSRAPNNQWKKCSAEVEAEIIKLRKQTKNKLGARKLRERFDIKYSESCINRIIRENQDLQRKKKTRTEKRNDLWSIKKLMDISNYYVQQWHNSELPKYEITARDVKTGATWVCLSDTKEASRTSAFVSMLIQHLKVHGFDEDDLTEGNHVSMFHNKYKYKWEFLF